jgi:MYXO-CTERM domain-containing protein
MESKGQRARVFGFGVGSSTNRSLIDGLSREGKGVAVYATTREDPARGVNQFFRYIDRSVLRDVSIDWGGFKVSDVTPGELPDLFASHPLIIHGRFSGKGSRAPVIRATSASGVVEIPVQVVAAKKGEPRDIAGALWARSKIRGLETDFASGNSGAQAEITKLGVDFGLVTRFTSFVAVDSSKRVGDGDPTRVVQPAERPEGVDVDAAGGKAGEQFRTPDRTASLKPDGDGSADKPRELHAVQTLGGNAPPAPADASDMEVQASRRGCACESAGERASPLGAIGLSLLVGLVALRRRRR